jgi:predicted permease
MWDDLKFGMRGLRRAPSFAAAAIVTLALGIGATTAIFTLVKVVLLTELPVQAPQQLYFVSHGIGETAVTFSNYALFERLRRRTDAFAGVTAYTGRTFKVGNEAGTELVQGQFVSGNYHALLGVRFAMGGGFAREDDRAVGGSPIAVISDGYWTRRFGRRPDVLGARLVVGGRTVTIVGVTAPDFEGLDPGRPRDITLPLSMRALEQPNFFTATEWIGMPLVARLRPDVSPVQATAFLDVEIAQFLAEPFNKDLVPEALGAFRLLPASQGSATLRNRYSRALTLLVGMVAVVLLIACVNVANLLLVRGAGRGREMALRIGLGASRFRVVVQLLTESLLLAASGGLLGVLLASWGTAYIGSVLRVGRNPTLIDLEPDGVVLAFATVVAMACGITSGLVPALRASRPDLAPALRGAASRVVGRLTGRRVLVGAQIALCLTLASGAGLLVRTLQNLQRVDGGFRTDRVLLFSLDRIGTSFPIERMPSLCGDVIERLLARGGIVSASCSTMSPADTSSDSLRISVPGFEPGAAVTDHSVTTNFVSPDYFKTLAVQLLAGRVFTSNDTSGSLPVAVVTKSMARYFFGVANPVGQRFTLGSRNVTIVGIVEDVRSQLREMPVRMAYVPLLQGAGGYPVITVALHTSGDPGTLAADVRREVAALDHEIAVDYLRTMEQQLDATLTRERLLAGLSAAFGGLALLLSCIGLYGVVSYDVARRTNEIGIRAALGATRGRLLRSVIAQTLAVSGAGIGAGLFLTMMTAPAVMNVLGADFLFGLTARDPRTVGIITLTLAATALVAGYLPARRATHVDPSAALRVE